MSLKSSRRAARGGARVVPLKLESNIQGVIDRMKRRPRDIRAALAATLSAPAWEAQMQAEARKTIWALASQPEWGFVDSFVSAVLVAPFPGGFFARMTNPLPPVLEVEDFMMARGLQTMALNKGTGPTLFSDFLNQFDDLMTDWVATEKNKDRRDEGKSDEEIGHFMGYLMLTPNSKLSEKEKAAKDKLLPHIADYIARRQKAKRLNADTINAWLLAVLAAWSALVRREFPVRFRAHLRAVQTEL